MEFSNPKLANYKYVETLGNGAQGTVYKVKDISGRRTYALKIFSTAMDVLAKRELKALEECNHANIVQIYDADLENRESYILMEYMKYGTIEQYIKQHDVSMYEKLLLLDDICEALRYMHDKNLIHRDIKPENIFVTDVGGKSYACLGDFGIVKEFGSTTLTKTSGGVGTMLYSPPEVLSGAERLSYASDVYALGMTLYELVAGKHAYDISSPMTFFQELMQKEVEKPSSHNTSVIEALDDLCLKAIQKKKEARYDTVSAFVKDLKTCLDFYVTTEESSGYETKRAIDTQRAHVTYDKKDESTMLMSYDRQVPKAKVDRRGIVRLLNLHKDEDFISEIKGGYDLKITDDLDSGKGCMEITGYNPEEIVKYADEMLLAEGLYLEGEMCYFENHRGYLEDPNALNIYIKTKECYEQAAELGNVDAIYSLGYLYMHAQSTKMQIESIFPMRELETREAFAVCLERLYAGIHKNYYLCAKEYFVQAVKKDHTGAFSMLGYLHAKGYGVDLNYKKSKSYFENASEKGCTNALLNLGILYCKGLGVTKDIGKGMQYIEEAAENNNIAAISCLSTIKKYGVDRADFFQKLKEDDLGKYEKLKGIKKSIWEQYKSR